MSRSEVFRVSFNENGCSYDQRIELEFDKELPKPAAHRRFQKIIQDNKDTEWGKKFGFGEIKNFQDFKRKHPITTYDDYAPYVQRMAEKGENNLLTASPAITFLTSSGTTHSGGKLIPLPQALVDEMKTGYDPDNNPFMKITMDAFGKAGPGKLLQFGTAPTMSKTPSGLPKASTSALTIMQAMMAKPFPFSSPPEVYTSKTGYGNMLHLHILFGLKVRDLHSIQCLFIPNGISMCKLLEDKYDVFVNELRTGKLDLDDIDEKTKGVLETKLGAHPERADELEKILARNDDPFTGIFGEIWQDLKVVQCMCSGDMFELVPTLRRYVPEKIIIYDMGYGMSEGAYGFNSRPLDPLPATFDLGEEWVLPELLHVDNVAPGNEDPIRPHDAKIGEMYELIITTMCGFYRYRTGDVLRVMGVEDGMLRFRFAYRTKMVSNLFGEKFSTPELQTLIRKLAELLECRVIDYTTIVDYSTHQPAYVICAEMENQDVRVSEKIEAAMESEFCSVNPLYERHRLLEQLSPVQIKLCSTGTFSRLYNILDENSPNERLQLKMPRLIRNENLIESIRQSML